MPSKKLANTVSTTQLIEQAVASMMREKRASQQEPDSRSSAETAKAGQNVDPKLKHKGDHYAASGMGSFGLEQTRDLLEGQGPNTGPLPDSPETNPPKDQSSLDDIPGNPIYTSLDPMGEPAVNRKDPGTQGDSVSEKLQLKKEASALMTKVADLSKQGDEIIQYLMQLTVQGGKQASAPAYTQEQLINEAVKLASVDTRTAVKTALAHLADDTIYAAEVTARAVKQARDENEEETEESAETEEPVQVPEEELQAMNDPDPGVEPDAGIPPGEGVPSGNDLSEEEAEALFAQALAENGVDVPQGGEASPEELPEDLAPLEGEGEAAPDDEILALAEELARMGITQEEVAEAMGELQAEEAAGIGSDAGALADEEALKTGHYKLASFIGRTEAKTAQQEQRAAHIRKMVRDLVRGPQRENSYS
jgi:hypothetical protein